MSSGRPRPRQHPEARARTFGMFYTDMRRMVRQKLRQGLGGPPRGSTAAKRRPPSVEAISWALHLAPVSAGRGGQPSTACKFVLVGLADHAEPDSTRQSCYAVGLHPCQFHRRLAVPRSPSAAMNRAERLLGASQHCGDCRYVWTQICCFCAFLRPSGQLCSGLRPCGGYCVVAYRAAGVPGGLCAPGTASGFWMHTSPSRPSGSRKKTLRTGPKSVTKWSLAPWAISRSRIWSKAPTEAACSLGWSMRTRPEYRRLPVGCLDKADPQSHTA